MSILMQKEEFMKLTVRNSNGMPYYSIIYREFDDNGIRHDFEGYSSYSLNVISDYLKKFFIPSIDPAKHGKWIIRDSPTAGWYRVMCSECGEDVTSTAPVIGFYPNAKVNWEFCPYCGARMERSEE